MLRQRPLVGLEHVPLPANLLHLTQGILDARGVLGTQLLLADLSLAVHVLRQLPHHLEQLFVLRLQLLHIPEGHKLIRDVALRVRALAYRVLRPCCRPCRRRLPRGRNHDGALDCGGGELLPILLYSAEKRLALRREVRIVPLQRGCVLHRAVALDFDLFHLPMCVRT